MIHRILLRGVRCTDRSLQTAWRFRAEVPISALNGDNVVRRGTGSPWDAGPPVLEFPERVPVDRPRADAPFRLPVQVVLRPDLEFRGFAGLIAGGSVRPGDRVRVLPIDKETRVKRIARAAEDGQRRAHWEIAAGGTLERAGDKPRVVTSEERERRWRQPARTVLCFGPPGSGKTRAAHALELFDRGAAVAVLDGQALRSGLSKDLGFGDEDRSENLRRAAEIARLLNEQGFTVILAMVAPDPAARARARDLVGADRWEERATGVGSGA
jgi:hypothetical protein